jgi:hypothetical protein
VAAANSVSELQSLPVENSLVREGPNWPEEAHGGAGLHHVVLINVDHVVKSWLRVHMPAERARHRFTSFGTAQAAAWNLASLARPPDLIVLNWSAVSVCPREVLRALLVTVDLLGAAMLVLTKNEVEKREAFDAGIVGCLQWPLLGGEC